MHHLRSFLLFAALALACASSGQTYFSTWFTASNGRLYRAADHCEPQQMTSTSGFFYADLTVLNDRRLLGYRRGGDEGFYLIDTITGQGTLLLDYFSTANALETESDTTVLFVGGGNGQLYRLHLLTLSVSTIGSIGADSDGDLLLFGGYLYVAAEPDTLLRVELTPDHQSIDQVVTVGQTMPDVWGLASPAGFQQEHPDCILAAAGVELYALNTITAGMTPLCQAITVTSFTGAAAYKGDLPHKPTSTHEGGPCNWSPRSGTVFIGEAGMEAGLNAWLPPTHTLLEWSLFDAAGRHVAGERSAMVGELDHLSQGSYLLRCVVQNPCGRRILVPTLRLHR